MNKLFNLIKIKENDKVTTAIAKSTTQVWVGYTIASGALIGILLIAGKYVTKDDLQKMGEELGV